MAKIKNNQFKLFKYSNIQDKGFADFYKTVVQRDPFFQNKKMHIYIYILAIEYS